MVLIFLYSFFNLLYATPDSFEVWFLTPPTEVSYNHKKNLFTQKCEPVGDYCLDPEIGLYKQENQKIESFEDIDVIGEKTENTKSPINRFDKSIITCDPKYAFDLFCGQANPEKNMATISDLEIWFDISSSMKNMDQADKDGNCFRKEFVKELKKNCSLQGVVIKGFDTRLNDISDDQVCQTVGMNDAKKLMKWIEESQVKKLIVITDAYEYQVEFANFIESKKGQIKGDRGHFVAKQMLNFVSDVAKSCEKKI